MIRALRPVIISVEIGTGNDSKSSDPHDEFLPLRPRITARPLQNKPPW